MWQWGLTSRSATATSSTLASTALQTSVWRMPGIEEEKNCQFYNDFRCWREGRKRQSLCDPPNARNLSEGPVHNNSVLSPIRPPLPPTTKKHKKHLTSTTPHGHANLHDAKIATFVLEGFGLWAERRGHTGPRLELVSIFHSPVFLHDHNWNERFSRTSNGFVKTTSSLCPRYCERRSTFSLSCHSLTSTYD